MIRSHCPLIACLCLSAAVALPGCGVRNFENENDRLRAVNLKLERELDELQTQLQLRTREIEAARQQLSGETQPIDGAHPPQVTTLALDRYTGAVDSDGDGIDDVVRIYVRPLDGQGRFLPVAGQVTVRLVTITETDPPAVLAERTYSPAQWDQAYRTGFTGTHYTLEIELPQPLPDAITQATLHVTLTEGVTGVKLTQQRVVKFTR